MTGGGGVKGPFTGPRGSTTEDGNQEVKVDHPGPDNGMQGVGGCYARQFVISNPGNGPDPTGNEGFVAFPGTYLLSWRGDCSGAPPDPSVDCVSREIITDTDPKWECICNVIQYGGPSVGANAKFALPASGPLQHEDAPGKPVVLHSDKSGAQLWWHYIWDDESDYIEIKHTDGTVAHFSRAGVLATNSSGDLWRLDWVRDPFDNQMTLHYDAQHGYLTQID